MDGVALFMCVCVCCLYQVALLYTSGDGQRRLRIHNLSLATGSKHIDIYRGCDQDTIVNMITKKGV